MDLRGLGSVLTKNCNFDPHDTESKFINKPNVDSLNRNLFIKPSNSLYLLIIGRLLVFHVDYNND